METQQNPDRLPDGFESYRRTDLFTEATLPAGLRKDHGNKADVWGVIHVVGGTLRYRVTDRRRDALDATLTPESGPGLVEPTILHSVEPMGPVAFYVEFHRPATEPMPLCREELRAREENRLRAEEE
ncbi:Uncharacterized protein, possibly involved in tellurite resistance [Faunimonas pinastri]|uniref:Uncharacterized protein, possibly involved in tellurite resistance n=1 Tax=Faunimonas pinastri TaxID=1855383 RepID=A0A1H9K420_9HYPH|nr:DUF1971 domain-containing protein [Faunimonas pinastri]SEQ93585.1 Uncharacterized protein, possibly involved in tellurite resistance [Faunimonas pinastri]